MLMLRYKSSEPQLLAGRRKVERSAPGMERRKREQDSAMLPVSCVEF
jgi:hypothetical protein